MKAYKWLMVAGAVIVLGFFIYTEIDPYGDYVHSQKRCLVFDDSHFEGFTCLFHSPFNYECRNYAVDYDDVYYVPINVKGYEWENLNCKEWMTIYTRGR